MVTQSWQATQYHQHASFVAELGSPVVSLLKPAPGESILDLGCGNGVLTEKIAQVGASVLGIDSSRSMVDAARKRGLITQVMSGEQLPFVQEFDAVFSNAALHWMTDYNAVIRGVFQSLKSPGRFVGEFGGSGNIATLIHGMEQVFQKNPEFGTFVNPWFFPSDDAYRKLLENHGFNVEYIELINRPTPLKTGVQEWLKLFADHVIHNLQPNQIQNFLTQVEDVVKPVLYSENNGWMADYVRLRFSATKA